MSNRRRQQSDSTGSGRNAQVVPAGSPALSSDGGWRMGSREAKDAIPKFKPGDDTRVTTTQWLAIVNQLALENGWSQQQKIHNAQMQLRGGAEAWYEANRLLIGSSWENFESKFRLAFPEELDFHKTITKMLQRKRSEKEALEDYVYDVYRMGVSIGYPLREILKIIMTGITDFRVRNAVKITGCSSVEELLNQLRDAEAMVGQDNVRKRLSDQPLHSTAKFRKKFGRAGDKSKEAEGKVKQDKSAISSKENDQEKSTKTMSGGRVKVKCFACRERGHFARDCPKKQDFRVRVLKRVSTQGAEYFKPAIVNGHQATAFVDLGASCSTITETCSNLVKAKREKVNAQLQGFGKGGCLVTEQITPMISVDEINKKGVLFVVPDDFQIDCDLILGNDFLNSEVVEVNKSYNSLNIRKKPIPQINRLNSVESVIKVSLDFSEADKSNMVELVQDFRDCFALNLLEIGCTHLIKMTITLKSQKPVQHKPRRLSYSQRENAKSIITDYQAANLVRGSHSAYASAIVMTPKPNGAWRICTDYRDLNEMTEKDVFPCPEVEESLSRLSGNRIFSIVDMVSGFLQVPLEENSIPLTGFVTPDGHYEYLRMPFGLRNAPQIFHRLMKMVTDGLDPRNFIVFMDDVLIASKTMEEHLEHLKMFFERLRMARLTLSPEKCRFLQTSVTFLGHKIDENGIQPGDTKILAVEQFPTPTSVNEVQRFLGLAGFFRKFVPDFAGISRPLTDLLKKGDDTSKPMFQWGSAQQQSFEKIKSVLVSKPVLGLYDPRKKHEIHTDASSHGIAGILIQVEDDGKRHPVAYYSRKATENEAKYPSYEMEALAVVDSVERFKYYLMDRKFTVITDCQALAATQRKKNIVPRVARWWMTLQSYDFDIQHKKADLMKHADALSRAPVEEPKEMIPVGDRILRVEVEPLDWVAAMQMQDESLREKADILTGKVEGHQQAKKIQQEYQLMDGKLYRKLPEGPRFVVPRFLQSQVIREAHTTLGHAGVDRVMSNLSKYYNFSRMRELVKKHLQVCINCCYYARHVDETRHRLHPVDRVPVPFHTVHLDLCGPYVTSKGGSKHILALVDAFTKFCVLRPVRDAKSGSVKKLLLGVSEYVGMPARVVTDHGSAFVSKDLAKFFEDHDIVHSLTAVAVPRGNGQVERYFRTLKPALASMLEDEDGRDWDTKVRAVQWSMNSLKNRTTGKSPQELLFSYTPRNILGNHLQNCVSMDLEEQPKDINLPELREEVNRRMAMESRRVAEKYNQSHFKPRKYQQGDLVLVLTSHPATGNSKKLLERYRGPYVVSNADRADCDRYEVADAEGYQLSQKPYRAVHAADRMKPWPRLEAFEQIDVLSEDEEEQMK